MTLPKTKFRELVFLILYRHHFMKETDLEDLSFYMHELKTTKRNVSLAHEYVQKILQHEAELDQLIKEASVGYELERIQSVELHVIKLALYEMLYDETVPEKVAIAEGLRLAKKFSTQDSVGYVNGILDQVYKKKSNLVYNTLS